MSHSLKTVARRIADAAGYDITHITRTVAYREVEKCLDAMPCAELDCLEVAAGWKWRQRDWKSFTEMNWPDHDICKDVLDRQFDIVIADNVWEHLLHPYRATRNVLAMLKPGGLFINITPFMIRHHPIPTDCTRWTELGMRHFLEDAGFDADRIETGSWGNADAVKANFHKWARTGWRRRLPNDPDFPVTVWAFAHAPG
ncbi:class I SAM-dependent methyltransferase [Novosphingobium marinum]|uniref:SAM-dependent methyltransferase n=1 Tax=Novosphingobium marinum TaxID=1514948 RepID=A0A7Y9XYH2_9SPHN|nr:class I SAM-dependent methyltransferase [Novosphingobium marinum]NYH96924.1 SAM-dependent methyltransferase [Novosphingobium marinum]